MQVFMILVAMAKSVYDAAIDITGVMILPAYLFCGLYLVKASFTKGELKTTDAKKILQYRIIGIISSVFLPMVIVCRQSAVIADYFHFLSGGILFLCSGSQAEYGKG